MTGLVTGCHDRQCAMPSGGQAPAAATGGSSTQASSQQPTAPAGAHPAARPAMGAAYPARRRRHGTLPAHVGASHLCALGLQVERTSGGQPVGAADGRGPPQGHIKATLMYLVLPSKLQRAGKPQRPPNQPTCSWHSSCAPASRAARPAAAAACRSRSSRSCSCRRRS